MKINKIDYSPPIAEGNCFTIYVNFSCSDDEVEFFGILGKYYKALAVPDIAAYEAHYADPKSTAYDLEPAGGGFSTVKWRAPNVYDLGLCKQVSVVGCDNINSEEDGTYSYRQYISHNYITEGAVKQLVQMKDDIDRGHCRWGSYPDQVGCFRSGSPISDFIGIIETLDRFWD